MQDILADLIQMVDKLPVLSLRMLPESAGWRASFVSRRIEDYGYAREDLLDGSLTWLDLARPDERARLLAETRKLLAGGEDGFRLDFTVLSPAGEEFPVSACLRPLTDRPGRTGRLDLLLFSRDGEPEPGASLPPETRSQMALNDIILSLAEQPSPEPLTLILDKAGRYLNVSRILLQAQARPDGPCRTLHEWLNRGVSPGRASGRGLLCGQDNEEVRGALDDNRPYAVNAGTAPRKLSGWLRERGVLAAALAPVRTGPDRRACLRFEDLKISRAWEENELDFIKNIAGLVSALLPARRRPGTAFSRRACETVLDNIGSFIFVADAATGEILFANRAFRNVFGEDCLGRRHADYLRLGPEQESEAVRGGGPGADLPGYETFLEKTGQWLAVTRDPTAWVDGGTAHIFNCYDITFKKNYEESIKRLAYLDHLTGLPNRYRCDADLRRAVSAARGGRPGYLLFIDLDDFKVINDSYGHHYGDAVLVSFAAFLRELFGEKQEMYRFGGDEFVVLLSGCDQDCLARSLEAVRERSQRPWKALNREFYCSLSIGVVEIGREASDPKTLLQRADIAMYEAKRGGKSNYVFYAEGLENATLERSEKEWLLREAMENDFQGFEIHYQPYFRAGDLRLLGAEALVRMRGRAGELLLPQAFIPLAEYLGFIVPLGEHILRTAAARCKAVNEAGRPDFSMTVNLSARQFRQRDIAERLEDVLRATGVNFANIIVAVSEGVALKELKHMLRICESFRRQGIRVALDDFGAGTSSFINLRDLPVDIIKVSSGYIDDYSDEYSGYFIRLVTELSHFSGKAVCMNGVEREEHYRFCKELGLDMVQGFLFRHPGSGRDLESLPE